MGRAWKGCFARRRCLHEPHPGLRLPQVTAVTKESYVAEAVYRAANDTSGQLRFPAGAEAVARSFGLPVTVPLRPQTQFSVVAN